MYTVLYLIQQYDAEFYLAILQNDVFFLEFGDPFLESELTAAVEAFNNSALTVAGLESDFSDTVDGMEYYFNMCESLANQTAGASVFKALYATEQGEKVSAVETALANTEIARVGQCMHFELSYPWLSFHGVATVCVCLTLALLYWVAEVVFTPVLFTQMPWDTLWCARSLHAGADALAAVASRKRIEEEEEEEHHGEGEDNKWERRNGVMMTRKPAACAGGEPLWEEEEESESARNRMEQNKGILRANHALGSPAKGGGGKGKIPYANMPSNAFSAIDFSSSESQENGSHEGKEGRKRRFHGQHSAGGNRSEEKEENGRNSGGKRDGSSLPQPTASYGVPSSSLPPLKAAVQAENEGDLSQTNRKRCEDGIISPLPCSPDKMGTHLRLPTPEKRHQQAVRHRAEHMKNMSPLASPRKPTMLPFLRISSRAPASHAHQKNAWRKLDDTSATDLKVRELSLLEPPHAREARQAVWSWRQKVRPFIFSHDYTAPRSEVPVNLRTMKGGIWCLMGLFFVFYLLSMTCVFVLRAVSKRQNHMTAQNSMDIDASFLPFTNRLGVAVLIDISLSCWSRAYLSLNPNDLYIAMSSTIQWAILKPVQWVGGRASKDNRRMPASSMTLLFSTVTKISHQVLYLRRDPSANSVYLDLVTLLDSYSSMVNFPGFETCFGIDAVKYEEKSKNMLLCLMQAEDCTVSAIPALMAMVTANCSTTAPANLEMYLVRCSTMRIRSDGLMNHKEMGHLIHNAVQPIEGDLVQLLNVLSASLNAIVTILEWAPWICVLYALLSIPIVFFIFLAAQKVQRSMYFG